ncbi:MAG TPA: ABC transporter substrate-binding protein [Vicinamibacterales bacterium]|nr:ABC transporter substrate-binding protein [Vicinamibacterales bacterium]
MRRLRIVLAGLAAALAACAEAPPPLQKVVINYPTRSGASWHLYLARDGGYYAKYGLDVDLQFGVHPTGVAMLTSGQAVMVNHSLEQAMVASARDASFALMGSSSNKGLFALIAQKQYSSPKELKGKRIAVGQIGDAPYNYTVALLRPFGIGPRDVQWIPVGTDVTGRAAALQTGRADATLLTAPNYFRLEEAGYRNLANLADSDVYAATTYMFSKQAIAEHPRLPEQIIKAHAEAIKRFYDDKAFAVKTYIAYDRQPEADVSRIYDLYYKGNIFDRVPYVLEPAVRAIIAQQVDPRLAADLQRFDFRQVIDNSVVDRLVKEGFFRDLFGPPIAQEEQRKAELAFR